MMPEPGEAQSLGTVGPGTDVGRRASSRYRGRVLGNDRAGANLNARDGADADAQVDVDAGSGVDIDLIVACCCRLHLKLTQSEELFDASWDCAPAGLQARLRWAHRLFHASGRQPRRRALFEHVIERLILLKPAELQRLLCAMSLLAQREDLRRCIDGNMVRALQAVVGTHALAAVLRSPKAAQPRMGSSDLSVRTLVAQGFSRLVRVYPGEWAMVLQCLRLALPANLPTVPTTEDEVQVMNLLREAHAWYPELTWLYG
jgi:hypothetical protein